FVTQDGEWLDPGLDGFDPAVMDLRRPGPVQALQGGRVGLVRNAARMRLPAAILACGCYSHNYFHFLLEVLPRVLAAASVAPAGLPLLTEDDLPPATRSCG
ncbi:MAG: hypothetical protein U1D06_05030, partial [Paracoccaceae bacterium]|nr:hypothetical protein [Paracoccaceae bacterium]